MDIRIVLAILGGFVLGLVFPYVRLRSGLTCDEWLYLISFFRALKNGNYDIVEDTDKDNANENVLNQ